jgi:hypothetical protein
MFRLDEDQGWSWLDQRVIGNWAARAYYNQREQQPQTLHKKFIIFYSFGFFFFL